MRNWMLRQYNDIRGNFKWALLASAWWLVAHYGKKLLQMIPNIPGWMVTAILLCSSLAVFLWLAKSGKSAVAPAQPSRITTMAGIPTLSALQGQTPQVTFNANEFFRTAYYSPLTAEIENNIKIAAQNYGGDDHDSFYARFIGVGYIAASHNYTWAIIYRSQLSLLGEMNRRVTMPISDARVYYDKAVAEFPDGYKSYSFDQWLEYLKREQLLIHHPSDMLEITHRGRVFCVTLPTGDLISIPKRDKALAIFNKYIFPSSD